MPAAAAARCAACRLRAGVCLCGAIPRVAARTHVAVLQHALETRKRSNSGWLAAQALARASLHVFGDRHAALDEHALLGGGKGGRTWLLYPEGAPVARAPAPLPARLIVLDGTWHQARRMRQRIAALRALPVLALPPPPAPRVRLRRAPRPEAMSTLEAIAAALALLEGEAVAAPLRALYAELVARSVTGSRRA